MIKNLLYLFMLITTQTLFNNFSYTQTFTESLEKINKSMQEQNDRLREELRHQEYIDQLERERLRKEEVEINRIKQEINEIQETTISQIQKLNTFDNLIFNKKFNNIIADFKNSCDRITPSSRNSSISSMSNARNDIYSLAMKTLRSDEINYLIKIESEKDKLFNFISQSSFTTEQIEKIKKPYNDFLEDPFKKDQYGKYIGYSFDINAATNVLPKSGTCFAISSEGYLVTNYHVVEFADKIRIRGINGNQNELYNAEVAIVDKNNDLAVLRINDLSFKSIKQIPYSINSQLTEVGENVYALGYPLTSTMGQEIKLTDGIVSSKTGYQGDITLYQISAPVQPGNSGGPLFDSKGNLIGIITAKHGGTENVTYAVKSIYLLNLIGTLEKTPKIPTKGLLKNKKLPEQVKKIKDFVYILETN